jgi:hypothetical protein
MKVMTRRLKQTIWIPAVGIAGQLQRSRLHHIVVLTLLGMCLVVMGIRDVTKRLWLQAGDEACMDAVHAWSFVFYSSSGSFITSHHLTAAEVGES